MWYQQKQSMTDWQTTDKVIPMWRSASLGPQNYNVVLLQIVKPFSWTRTFIVPCRTSLAAAMILVLFSFLLSVASLCEAIYRLLLARSSISQALDICITYSCHIKIIIMWNIAYYTRCTQLTSNIYGHKLELFKNLLAHSFILLHVISFSFVFTFVFTFVFMSVKGSWELMFTCY